ncbi:MAG: 3'-5' exonuclease domain-containing protein 2 [Muribaculaceae bacterium]|nr:3'-5' exonuclease domain-containing protein 2 [Muribaculaceae bacterium]
MEVPFKICIDKTQVNEMPQEVFKGQIHVIDSMMGLRAAIAALRRAPLVGFDTETRPSFRKGVVHKPALVQLSTLDDCFLFRVNKIGMPDALKQYLADESCPKVGLSIHDDFNVIHRMADVEPGGFVELQQLVGQYHIVDIGLQKIYAILFHKKISKGQRLTNWETPSLTPAQQSYAAIDAWACVKIYNYLMSGQFVPEASPFVTPIEDEEKI